MISFSMLVKEEPSCSITPADMEVATRLMPLQPQPPQQARPATSIPDSQMQNLAQMTANIPQALGPSRGEIDPVFEPVSRLRSNTWPRPGIFMDNEDATSLVEPSTSGESNRAPEVATPGGFLEASGGGGGGPTKKNTSRRNPWGNMSYADLIAQAIASTPEDRATLSQIYDWMVQNIPYFKDKGDSNSSAGWKNSIRHNLSLHSRFMRMQNEGTGKSSWWVLNPDAKPGKSTRRRANTLEAGGRLEKKRGRVRKKPEVNVMRNGIDNPVSPNIADMEYFPASPPAPPHHGPFQLSPQDYRPRASSNASSCGGRLSPIPAIEADMHDSQVPPMSPGAWGPDYWSGPHHMGRIPHHEPYADQIAESMASDHFTLGAARESWASHHPMTPGGPHPPPPPPLHNLHPHSLNGFVNHHPPHPSFGNYEDFPRFGPHISHGPKFFPHHSSCEKTNHAQRPPHPFQMSPLQSISPANSLSPPNGVGDFSASSCEGDLRPNPSFSSPQSHPQSTPPTAHGGGHPPGSTNSPLAISSTSGSHVNHSPPNHQDMPPGSTAMLRVALSHKEASPYAHLNGPSRPNHPGGPGAVADLPDLDNFQGGLECNVEEVIKHELQYEDHLNFDFHGQSAAAAAAAAAYAHHGHSFANSRRDSATSQLTGNGGPSSVYSCPSIPAGNQWVR